MKNKNQKQQDKHTAEIADFETSLSYLYTNVLLPEGFELTNGSTVNIACVLIPYNTPQAGAGAVALHLYQGGSGHRRRGLQGAGGTSATGLGKKAQINEYPFC